MEFKSILRLSVIFTIFAAAAIKVYAVRRIILRPLSAEEVVRILKIAGREDAVPEGRVVTQGLAAMTGFALGLTKGIGGSLLFDLATSNATSEFIGNFNATAMMNDFQGINMTTLMQMFKWDPANTSSAIRYKTTEICFGTRIKDPVVGEMARQAVLTSFIDPTYAADKIGTGTADATGTGTGTADRTATNTNRGTNSNTETTTQTGKGSDQTCIVMQKPILRKRRSSHRKGRRSF